MKKIDSGRKKKIGKRLLAAGAVCLVAALGIFTYNKITDYRAGVFARSVVDEMKEYIDNGKKNPEKNTGGYDVKFKGYYFMGYLEIPRLDRTLPVMSDWNYDKLSLSPCRYSGSVITGDLVIAAHNYESHFGNIYQLEKDDVVTFTDMQGKTYRYKVVLTEEIEPTEIGKMTSGEYDLSLFTCNWLGNVRVTVRCDRKY